MPIRVGAGSPREPGDEQAFFRTVSTLSAPALRRQYVKLCDVRDFDDPLLRERIGEIVPGLEPKQEVHRKYWEYAMLTLFMEDVGALDEETEALSVAAGHEHVLFWLANRIGRVVATDIYGQGSFAHREADVTMVQDAAAFAPYPYREDRLEVMEMNALELRFPDAASTSSSPSTRLSTSAAGRKSSALLRRWHACCALADTRSSLRSAS